MTDSGHLDPVPARRRGLPLPAVLGIVLGGIALLVVAVIVVAVVVVSNVTRTSASATTDASAVVRSYLTAIAAGKASTARGYLTGDEADSPLLTQTVLSKSRALAPMTGIRVGKPTGSQYYPDVPATFRLGDKTVTTKFTLTRDEDKTFTLSSGLAPLQASRLKGLDLTVNGVKTTMPTDGLKLFPGVYDLAVVTPSLALDGDSRVQLAGPDQSSLTYNRLESKLTEQGLTSFRSLVTRSVKKCLAATTLKAGCGLTLTSPLRDGTKVDEGSVHRTMTPQLKAKLAHLQPTPDLDTPTLLTATVAGSPDVTATGSHDGQHGQFSLILGPTLGSASIDISQPTPEVDWR